MNELPPEWQQFIDELKGLTSAERSTRLSELTRDQAAYLLQVAPHVFVTIESSFTRDIRTKVVGVTKGNDNGTNRQDLVRRCSAGDPVALVPDPHNKYDEKAVMVLWRSQQLGFLKRKLAAELGEIISKGGLVDGRITEVTGGTKGKETMGVNLELSVCERKFF